MVDDEQDINVTIKTVLEETESFQVDTFNNAESALSLFKPNLYDLALLDIRMPGMNGLEFVNSLRAQSQFKHLPVIFLTHNNKLPRFALGSNARSFNLQQLNVWREEASFSDRKHRRADDAESVPARTIAAVEHRITDGCVQALRRFAGVTASTRDCQRTGRCSLS
jgi:CheY-like chemotaxis protein